MKTWINLVLAIGLLGGLYSCGAIVKAKANQYATVEQGAIPEDFGVHNDTVLFITYRNSYNKYLKRNLRKVYKGPHELVTQEELASETYTNVAKYRYVFDYTYNSYQYQSNNETLYGPGGGTGTGQVRRFHVLDRLEQKEYVMPMTSSFWSKLQRIYLKNLEMQRVKNQAVMRSNP